MNATMTHHYLHHQHYYLHQLQHPAPISIRNQITVFTICESSITICTIAIGFNYIALNIILYTTNAKY